MSKLNYVDIERIARKMSSKELTEPFQTWEGQNTEFVALEEAICALLSTWIRDYGDYPEAVGYGFGNCPVNLYRFLSIINGYAADAWEGFGGGKFGGGGASGSIIHWPWQGNPFKVG